MPKIHNTPDGPKPCSASVKDCKYGGSEGGGHFDSMEEAQAAYEKKMSSENNVVKGVSKSKKTAVTVDTLKAKAEESFNDYGVSTVVTEKNKEEAYAEAAEALKQGKFVVMEVTADESYATAFDLEYEYLKDKAIEEADDDFDEDDEDDDSYYDDVDDEFFDYSDYESQLQDGELDPDTAVLNYKAKVYDNKEEWENEVNSKDSKWSKDSETGAMEIGRALKGEDMTIASRTRAVPLNS